MEHEKKKVLLIVNPCAGRTKSRAGTFEIVDKFSKNDYEFSIHTTTCCGDATEIVKKNYDGKELVVCCGGDGTLNETINGVMRMPNRIPVGYIPSGSTNDLACTLGIPTDIKKATDLIMSGQTNSYDLGLFNNRCFSYIASFGAFTKASYATSQKLKNKIGHAAYILSGAKEFFNIRPIRARIEYDGGVLDDDFIFGSISNTTSVAGIFKFKPEDIKLNDGIFELLLARRVSLAKVPHIMGKVIRQDYDGKEIIYLKTSKLKITFKEPVAWTLDGEFGGEHKKVNVQVLEKAVDICTPENPMFIKEEPHVFLDEEPEEDAAEKTRARMTRKEKRAAKAAETEKAAQTEAVTVPASAESAAEAEKAEPAAGETVRAKTAARSKKAAKPAKEEASSEKEEAPAAVLNEPETEVQTEEEAPPPKKRPHKKNVQKGEKGGEACRGESGRSGENHCGKRR